jgi:hypothetical protein
MKQLRLPINKRKIQEKPVFCQFIGELITNYLPVKNLIFYISVPAHQFCHFPELDLLSESRLRPLADLFL